jgi:hypothetical protein
MPTVLMCSLIVAEPFACGVLCKTGWLTCGCHSGEVVGSWAIIKSTRILEVVPRPSLLQIVRLAKWVLSDVRNYTSYEQLTVPYMGLVVSFTVSTLLPSARPALPPFLMWKSRLSISDLSPRAPVLAVQLPVCVTSDQS